MNDDVFLPYDPGNPPSQPPQGCADPVLWSVSFALRRAHRPRSDGWCECRKFWPCATFALADESLRAAYERSPLRQRSRGAAPVNVGRWSG